MGNGRVREFGGKVFSGEGQARLAGIINPWNLDALAVRSAELAAQLAEGTGDTGAADEGDGLDAAEIQRTVVP
jgi:hypothetical protein